eukprot:5024778-Alexandrium_andersonii.AAC.1
MLENLSAVWPVGANRRPTGLQLDLDLYSDTDTEADREVERTPERRAARPLRGDCLMTPHRPEEWVSVFREAGY